MKLRTGSERYPRIKFEVTVDGFAALSKKLADNQVDFILSSDGLD